MVISSGTTAGKIANAVMYVGGIKRQKKGGGFRREPRRTKMPARDITTLRLSGMLFSCDLQPFLERGSGSFEVPDTSPPNKLVAGSFFFFEGAGYHYFDWWCLGCRWHYHTTTAPSLPAMRPAGLLPLEKAVTYWAWPWPCWPEVAIGVSKKKKSD